VSLRTELLEKYQIRKTKAQKTEFIEYVKGFAAKNGYSARIEGKGNEVRNIVIGDIDSAKVIYTAHYDTPPVMLVPNFITPKNFLIYFVYQMLIVVALLAPAFAAMYLVRQLLPDSEPLSLLLFILIYYAEMLLLLFGPANKHTANDNTSGVATVLGIAERLSGRELPAAFVLFDQEETGLVGSRSFSKAHKGSLDGKLIVNFDCVSDGSKMLFVFRKGAREDLELLRAAYPSVDGIDSSMETKGVFYPSDQASFKRAVGVAAFTEGPMGILYTSRIHTPRDTVFDERNIDYLIDGSEELATLFSETDGPVLINREK